MGFDASSERVIPNQFANWCGNLHRLSGYLSSYRPFFCAVFWNSSTRNCASIREIATPVCALARNDREFANFQFFHLLHKADSLIDNLSGLSALHRRGRVSRPFAWLPGYRFAHPFGEDFPLAAGGETPPLRRGSARRAGQDPPLLDERTPGVPHSIVGDGFPVPLSGSIRNAPWNDTAWRRRKTTTQIFRTT